MRRCLAAACSSLAGTAFGSAMLDLVCARSVGAAVCTGDGDEMLKHCMAHTVVEAMRNGAGPDAACQLAVDRVLLGGCVSMDPRVYPACLFDAVCACVHVQANRRPKYPAWP